MKRITEILFIAILFTSCNRNTTDNESYKTINQIIEDNNIQIPYIEKTFYSNVEVLEYIDQLTEVLTKNEILEIKHDIKTKSHTTVEKGKLVYHDSITKTEIKSLIVNYSHRYNEKICKISAPYFTKNKNKVILIRREVYDEGTISGGIYLSVYEKRNGKWFDITPFVIDIA